MDERLKFVAECETSDESMTQICARYAVSRKTGYKWLARWQSSRNLADLSRAPHQVGWAIAPALAELRAVQAQGEIGRTVSRAELAGAQHHW
jgi:transposase-like protein